MGWRTDSQGNLVQVADNPRLDDEEGIYTDDYWREQSSRTHGTESPWSEDAPEYIRRGPPTPPPPGASEGEWNSYQQELTNFNAGEGGEGGGGPGMFGNMFSGSKSAGRAMQAGGDMGAGLGNLIGGLMSVFGGQPHAMMDAYKRLQAAYQNIDDPAVQRDLWNAPIFRQIAQYSPEMVRDLTESVDDMETYEEGDASLRTQEDVALARVSERARRGDPLAQRIQTQQAQAGVGRALGRAGETAQEQAARRGMPGQGAPGLAQAGADYASRVGQQNVLAARGDQARAEMGALSGASSIRASRESATERAMNIRNNFRNAMSNRQLSIALTNQQARQQSSDRNQTMAQRLHESNLDRQDKRALANRDQNNRWETEEYARENERVTREGRLDIEIGQAEDAARAAETANVSGLISGAGKFGGTLAGAAFHPGDK